MPSMYEKNKPWDTDDIDKWKIDPFKKEDNAGGNLAEESSFMTLFPKYREVYLKEAWPIVTQALKGQGIDCTLDLVEGSMTVRTTLKTFDPAAILNARDLIKLLARSVPAQQAIRILEDGCACDIIKIRNLVNNKAQFVKRRQRILGADGGTLKCLQMLTETYILVHGNTVSVMGPYKGIKEIRRVVEDCMHNIHPIYHIKELVIRRKLAQDPEMADKNWGPYLPKFKKRVLNRRRVPYKVKKKDDKPYTPFPPPPEKSKVDKELETGEYFMSKADKQRTARQERIEKQEERRVEKESQRAKAFIPPEEPGVEEEEKKKKKQKKEKSKDREKKRKREKDVAAEGEETGLDKKHKKKRRKSVDAE